MCTLCGFAPEALLARAQPEVPSCSLADRTPLVPCGALDLGAVRRFLAQVVLEAIRGDGRTCLYAQRTAENSAAFSAVFAILKIGPDDEAAVRAYAPLSPPGWLAWARDDFFHADAASSIDLSCRLLAQFAEGSSECVICLERILDPPQAPGSSPSSTCTGLPCGHQLHTHCLVSLLGRPPPHACPVCRAAFTVDAATGALRDDAGAARDDRVGEYHEADIRLALDLEARRLEEEARCGACCTIS